MNSVFRQLTQTVIQRFCDLSPIDTNQSLCCTPARDTYAHNRIFLVQVFGSHCSSLTPHHSSKNLPSSLLEFTQYIPQICYYYHRTPYGDAPPQTNALSTARRRALSDLTSARQCTSFGLQFSS